MPTPRSYDWRNNFQVKRPSPIAGKRMTDLEKSAAKSYLTVDVSSIER
jgi:hypothetical protein